jgi:aryl-alcohol dehydrogenase-like predicted oxidoreductase
MYSTVTGPKKTSRAVEKLMKLAEEHGLSILELAMKWCDSRSAVTSIISGVSRLEQIKQNITVLEGAPLSAEILAACDDVWHGLSGTRFAYNR